MAKISEQNVESANSFLRLCTIRHKRNFKKEKKNDLKKPCPFLSKIESKCFQVKYLTGFENETVLSFPIFPGKRMSK